MMLRDFPISKILSKKGVRKDGPVGDEVAVIVVDRDLNRPFQ